MKHGAVTLAGVSIVVVAGLLAGCSPAPRVEPRSSREDGIRQSDALLEQILDAAEPGCSGAVAIDGERVWAGAKGVTDLDTRAALTTESEFDFASVSKQFTATAVLLLVNDGALSLTDSLADWVPGLPAWAELVTIADLMHHTSGIPDYTGALLDQGFDLEGSASQADALVAIAASSAKPGEATFEYSNSNYVLLAEVVQAASGMPLADLLTDRVFAGAALALQPDSPRAAPGHANGSPAPSGWSQIGDGSVVGTPSALVQWADYYRSGTLDGVKLAPQAVAEAVDTGGPDGSSYGAGIMIATDGALSHMGSWAGTVTLFGVSADRRAVIAVSCNRTDAPVDGLAQGLRTIWT